MRLIDADALKPDYIVGSTSTGTECYRYVSFEQIMNTPTADIAEVPRWIPVTERLPERGVSVLISHVGYVTEDYLDIDDGVMYFWNSGIDLEEELENLAWMPLPAPWEGGES